MLGGLFNNLAAKEGLASSADKKTLSPRMKVFTVGLDQKPPLKNDLEKAEKTSSPPPGYSATTTQHVPLPVGPELPLPPTPLIMRKSRGYKGILLVMLSVFLIALFALTLSEIAYNRQRDENFFRLRWAELKHRLGSYADYDYYFNRNPYTYSINRQKELGQPIVPTSFNQQQQPLMQQPQQQQQSVTAEESTSTSTPVLAEVIDTSKTGSRRPLGADLTSLSGTSLSHSSSSSSQQTSAEQPITLTPSDTRLQFLRSILRRIKQHAEDMGFDGMMQVSVIEVEPQGEELNGSRKLGAPSPAIQQILPGLFSHLIGGQSQQQQQPSHVDEPQMLNVKSDAFLDGFGEIHQPSFLQNNQIAEQNRAHFENNDNNNNHNNNQRNNNDEPPIEFEGPIQWSRVNNPIGAEEFFRPSNWHLTQQQQQQQQPQLQQQQAFPPQFPQVLPRPFEQWSSNGVSDDEFMPRRFGQQPQAPTEPAQAPQHHQISPPMIQVFPQSAPLFFPPPVSQQSQQPQAQPLFNQFPAGQMLGVGADSEFRHFKAIAPPPPPPSVFEFPSGRPQSLEFPPPPQSNGVENNQEMGEMHGGKIGQFVKELIANRLQTLSQLQQQSQQQQQAGQLEQLNPMV